LQVQPFSKETEIFQKNKNELLADDAYCMSNRLAKKTETFQKK
jgi:hypothetical protein